MVQFVTENPAIKGAQDMQTVLSARTNDDLNRLRIEELQRTRDSNLAIDKAVGEELQRQLAITQPAAMPQPAGPSTLSSFGGPKPQARPMPQITQTPLPAPGAAGQAPQGGQIMYQTMPAQPGPMIGGTGGQPTGQPTATQQPGAPVTPAPEPLSPGAQTAAASLSQMGYDRRALARVLSGVEGGGAKALELMEDQDELDRKAEDAAKQEHNDAVTNFFAAMKNGDAESAKFWAGQAQMAFTPEMIDNIEFQQHMGTLSDWKSLYGSDTTGFGNFVGDTIQQKAANPQGQVDYYGAFQRNQPTERIQPTDYDKRLAWLKQNGTPEEVKAFVLGQKAGGSGAALNKNMMSPDGTQIKSVGNQDEANKLIAEGWHFVTDSAKTAGAGGGGGGDGKFGTTAYYVKMDDGSIRIAQISDTGTMAVPALPPGVSQILEPVTKVDNGTGTDLVGTRSAETKRVIPKDIAGAAAMREFGKTMVEKGLTAPGIIRDAKRLQESIDSVRENPLLPYVTGVWSLASAVPGTDLYDLGKEIKYVRDQLFKPAFDMLRGAGAITEQESEKAQGALSRLDQAQTTEGFLQALSELDAVLENAKAAAQGNEAMMNKLLGLANGTAATPQYQEGQILNQNGRRFKVINGVPTLMQ